MKINVLIIGSGGREHALAWKLAQSLRIGKLYVAPGNGGTHQIAENVSIDATDIEGLIQFAEKNEISLTVVGPDDPLRASHVTTRVRCRARICYAMITHPKEWTEEMGSVQWINGLRE